MKRVVVFDSFDDLRSSHVRFLEESARLGDVHVLLWSDDAVQSVTGSVPKFPQAERFYLLEALRYVREASLVSGPITPDALPQPANIRPGLWVVDEKSDTPAKRAFCRANRLGYHVLAGEDIAGFPAPEPVITAPAPGRKKIIVTGCYDWFHSGHVRFFEEVSRFGDLYVVAGNDANVRLLKGEGHPLFREEERRYLCGSVRHVKQALISTGMGWLDAEPEIRKIRPDIYAVNEDGDRPEKREYCEEHGIRYLVLKRTPKEGLARRSSTTLRGF